MAQADKLVSIQVTVALAAAVGATPATALRRMEMVRRQQLTTRWVDVLTQMEEMEVPRQCVAQAALAVLVSQAEAWAATAVAVVAVTPAVRVANIGMAKIRDQAAAAAGHTLARHLCRQ
jgi:hypothetical protein